MQEAKTPPTWHSATLGWASCIEGMGVQLLNTRLSNWWMLWAFAGVLFLLTTLSYVLKPRFELLDGDVAFGTSHSVHLSNGAMIYERTKYSNMIQVLDDPSMAVPVPVGPGGGNGWRWEIDWGRAWSGSGTRFASSGVWMSLIPFRVHQSGFSVPLLSLSVLLSSLSRTTYLSDRARRRRRAGCCGLCNYSLEGLDGGVCPECGGEV
jgi:hypothetical protein